MGLRSITLSPGEYNALQPSNNWSPTSVGSRTAGISLDSMILVLALTFTVHCTLAVYEIVRIHNVLCCDWLILHQFYHVVKRMALSTRSFITTPIFYVNASKHILLAVMHLSC